VIRRGACGLLILGVLVSTPYLLVAGPAAAAPAPTQAGNSDDDAQVVITGRVLVARDERVGNVVILNGDAVINGRVDGSVFAANGDVLVRGSVEDDVHAFNGRVIVDGGARIGGDVTSREKARVSPGATVDGDVKSVSRRFSLGWAGAVAAILIWLAVILSTLVLGLLLLLIAPRAADAFADAGRTAVGASIGLGIAAAVGLPIIGLALLASVIGLPLGAVVLLALGFLYTLGYVASAYFLGRLILRPPQNRFLAYLVGWGILSVAGVIPVLNVLTFLAATVYGVGMIVVATFRARKGPREPAPRDAGNGDTSRADAGTGRPEPSPAS
jgi:Na+-transporting methylmalonyl-CoA/oxaloacetate decarboxylase gamma subunit/cytoskeletal protein CcmA (bactofilin family)